MERTRSVFPELAKRLDRGEPLVLATIVETSGSTPQVPGASALFGAEGLILGTLGGGALEGEAGRRAAACLSVGLSLFFRFKLLGRDIAAEEPLCGGEASILIDGSPDRHRPALHAMRQALESRRRGCLVSLVSVGESGDAEIRRSWVEGGGPFGFGPPPEAFLSAEGERTPAAGEPKIVWTSKAAPARREFFFFEPMSPLPRLLIAGAGHIGQALARLGARLDFEVTVIDDRAEFASPLRFPDADRLIVSEPGQALRDLTIEEDAFIVIVTRGHRDDAAALRACVRSRAAYVGMIGSRTKVEQAREEFIRQGWATAEEFDRVHSPIGLAIGSRTVEEIAVSIAAELVRVRSRRGAEGK